MKKPLAELNKCLYILEARQIVTHMYRKPNHIIHIPCVQYLSNQTEISLKGVKININIAVQIKECLL